MDDIKHIYFDLDHTLWDFETNSKETLGELYVQHELENKGIANMEQFVDRYILINEKYWKMYRENRLSKARLRTIRFETVLNDFGIDDKRLSKRIGEDYLDQCPQKTRLNPGALEALDALGSEFPLHILSNGFHEVQMVKMKCSGIEGYFDEIITSEKANAKKPNPRIFKYANRLCSASPEESIMIGDNLHIDVIGAQEVGWKAIHYNPNSEVHEHQSIKSLDQLNGLLLK